MPGNPNPTTPGLGHAFSQIQRFYVPFKQPARYPITGITRDSTGAALGNCTVEALETGTDLKIAMTVSNANGLYSLDVEGDRSYYLVAYKAGSPDVSGTTVNTLTGTAS